MKINKQMASAASTDDSEIAPTDFPLSSSEDDLLDKNGLTDRCPLCRSSKKYFYCADCIRNGDFYSSQCVQRESSQRFVEKKMSLLKVKGEIQELLIQSQTILANKNKIETLQQELRNAKERVQLLKKWKEEAHKSLLTKQGKLDELKQKRNESRQLQLANSKLMTANPASTANAVLLNQLEADKSQLKEIIQENVKVLLTVVFPIVCEGLPNGEEDSESLANVKNALADASQTAYVRGQWVYADTGHNGRYCIAGAYLPGTGDMAAYQLCVDKANKNGDIETLRHFKVALSHVTQLSQILAFYFGVRLPKRVAHLDFIQSDLDPKRFAGRIARLHSNVLFLCASQGVAPIHLRHANPLAKLSTLLEPNICDLGRSGPYEFHPEIWSFEDVGEDDGSPVSASSSEGEEDGDLNADWESVGHLTNLEATEESNRGTSPVSPRNNDNPVTNSVVSVVSGVASLWKAFPWSK